MCNILLNLLFEWIKKILVDDIFFSNEIAITTV